MKAGFKGTGIFPLKPDIIPDCAFAPNLVTHIDVSADLPPETPLETNDTAALGRPGPSGESNAAVNSQEASDQNMSPASFRSLLATPQKTGTPCRKNSKSINSLATVLTKDIFLWRKNSDEDGTSAPSTSAGNFSAPTGNKRRKIIQEKEASTISDESWYCTVCCQDKVLDMRKCVMCNVYVHEICVGLTKKDKGKFVCPHCS